MYLAQLLINLYDGRLLSPFTSMPTKRPLENLDEFWEESREPDRRASDVSGSESNKELPLDKFNHVSSDGRIYIAIQSLANGLFGYLAVTIGNIGTDPLWVNSQGETV